MMVDREQLKRDCADALATIQTGKGVLGIENIPDQLVDLGVS